MSSKEASTGCPCCLIKSGKTSFTSLSNVLTELDSAHSEIGKSLKIAMEACAIFDSEVDSISRKIESLSKKLFDHAKSLVDHTIDDSKAIVPIAEEDASFGDGSSENFFGQPSNHILVDNESVNSGKGVLIQVMNRSSPPINLIFTVEGGPSKVAACGSVTALTPVATEEIISDAESATVSSFTVSSQMSAETLALTEVATLPGAKSTEPEVPSPSLPPLNFTGASVIIPLEVAEFQGKNTIIVGSNDSNERNHIDTALAIVQAWRRKYHDPEVVFKIDRVDALENFYRLCANKVLDERFTPPESLLVIQEMKFDLQKETCPDILIKLFRTSRMFNLTVVLIMQKQYVPLHAVLFDYTEKVLITNLETPEDITGPFLRLSPPNRSITTEMDKKIASFYDKHIRKVSFAMLSRKEEETQCSLSFGQLETEATKLHPTDVITVTRKLNKVLSY